MIRVVAGLVRKDGFVLIAKRSHGLEVNKWEFPGGKLEENEDEKDAIKREMLEELKIEVLVKDKIATVVHEDVNRPIELTLYDCEYLSGEVELSAHFRYKWVLVRDLKNYEMPPADLKLLEYIK